jgi:hypothetical protein
VSKKSGHRKFNPEDPTGVHATDTPVQDMTYLRERMAPLGWTDENNLFDARRVNSDKEEVEHLKPLFEADEHGNIIIHYYTVRGVHASYKRGENKWAVDYVLKRLRVPRIDAEGREHKYHIPSGAGTFPWLAPNVIEAYRKGEPIKTLVMTEGAIKGFAGYLAGLHMVGLTSITHYKDRHIETLHSDILEVIKRCAVQQVIWLVDGDCKDLTKEWQEKLRIEHEATSEDREPAKNSKDEVSEPDLAKRPTIFFSSAKSIRELLKDYGVDLYFAHVQSSSVPGAPKGLDDLLLAYGNLCLQESLEKGDFAKVKPEVARQTAIAEVVHDLTSFSAGQPRFFHRLDISHSIGKLKKYFGLEGNEQFYQTYADLIGDRAFVYHGTKYKWNADKGELEMLMPGAAKDYARVGDNYYEWVNVPRKMRDGKLVTERVLHGRQSGTIKTDHGQSFLNHVPKYKAFCNVPDHENHQLVVHNCLNVYYPFEHVPEEGECPNILGYLKHIFGEKEVHATHPKRRDAEGKLLKYSVNELELGIDYIQLLYQQPTQILPILCLVSSERNTGKTTMAKFLKLLFSSNAVMVGNKDFENDFNALWATKLAVMCDEAFIDKKVVIERIKSLSTADRISMNAKGKDQVEVDFFAKFILLSNNEDNFIYTDDQEVRFWVRKVPVIPETSLDVDLLAVMREEIPAFLWMMSRRKMATECLHRAWFDPKLLATDALRKVIEYSKPTVVKEVHEYMRDLFFRTRVEEIYMDANDVATWVFGGRRYELNYLNKLLSTDMKMDRFKRATDGKYVTKTYTFPAFSLVKDHTNGNQTLKRVDVEGNGRPFVFKREDFVGREEWESNEYDGVVLRAENSAPPAAPELEPVKEEELDGLFGKKGKRRK